MADTIYSATAYDDVFRTLINECSKLIIPVINETFGENYTGEEEIIFAPDEHFLNQQGGAETKRITDSSFIVIGKTKKRYHFECQSTADLTILVRIFEYDAQIALDQDSQLIGNSIIVSFPNTAVLYLRSRSSTPDAMEIIIRTPGGKISYQVPVMKVKAYSIAEIFEKKLYFLIPFYIFTYEAQFSKINSSESHIAALTKEYQGIASELERLTQNGEISEFYKRTIMDMSEKVLQNLAANYGNILKGVGAIMGGQVLDYEAKRIHDDGINEGRSQGIDEGINEGINGTVKILRGLGYDDRTIVRELSDTYKLSYEKAEKYVSESLPG